MGRDYNNKIEHLKYKFYSPKNTANKTVQKPEIDKIQLNISMELSMKNFLSNVE